MRRVHENTILPTPPMPMVSNEMKHIALQRGTAKSKHEHRVDTIDIQQRFTPDSVFRVPATQTPTPIKDARPTHSCICGVVLSASCFFPPSSCIVNPTGILAALECFASPSYPPYNGAATACPTYTYIVALFVFCRGEISFVNCGQQPAAWYEQRIRRCRPL